MMYDDIANNAVNPYKGIIINAPNGTDVYHGVSKDYTGAEVTPINFLNVLKGISVGGKKVLKSTADDQVFVFFSDHGGPGLIAFPTSTLQATDLNNALEYMTAHSMYNQLVFYLEACESGSMFNTLLKTNTKIFATTASDPATSSYACYYDAKRGTYLGDVYSVNWMEDSDRHSDLSQETLQQQFLVVKKNTTTSVVCEYGDMSVNTQPLSEFQGDKPSRSAVRSIPNPKRDAVCSREVPVEILKHKIKASTGAEQAQYISDLANINKERAALTKMFQSIVSIASGEANVALHMNRRVAPTVASMECLRMATESFGDQCVPFSQYDYALKLAMSFVSMCESGISGTDIVKAINTACPTPGLGTFVGGVF